MSQDFAPFNGKVFTVETRSGRTFELRELSGADIVDAAAMVPDNARGEIEIYLRIALAIQSVDGQPLPPGVGRNPMFARLKMLSGTELDDLAREYFKQTSNIAELPKE